MHPGAVIALQEILPEDLPIAGEMQGLAMTGHQPLQRPIGEALPRLLRRLREGNGIGRQIDEQEPAPVLEGDGEEPLLASVEARACRRIGGSEQFSAQRICPGVIGAGQHLGGQPAALLEYQAGAPMTAGIVKGADARFAAQQQDVLVANGECPEFAECVQILRAGRRKAIRDTRCPPSPAGDGWDRNTSCWEAWARAASAPCRAAANRRQVKLGSWRRG